MMRLPYFALALLPFTIALTGCQATDLNNFRENAVQLLQQKNPSKNLNAYHWRTDTGAPKPLVLNFSNDGHLAISTSCNSLSTSWKVEGSNILTGRSAGTMMGCAKEASEQEKLASNLFDNRSIPFILNMENTEQPTLTLHDATGKRYIFTGTMTPETKYQGEGEILFFEINPQKKKCEGVATQSCLQVKEIRYNTSGVKTYTDAKWNLFYGNIEGFTHNPKERQVIRVKRYNVKNAAADQSKYAYIHDMTIERSILK